MNGKKTQDLKKALQYVEKKNHQTRINNTAECSSTVVMITQTFLKANSGYEE